MEIDSYTPVIFADELVSTPIVTEFGHARSLTETFDWVKPKLRHVPITRVYDATPLDFLGLPVWAAVTPLASDLTVHAGKGLTPLASRLSAVMEAIERVCGESMTTTRVTNDSFNELSRSITGRAVLDPQTFDLPFNTTYTPDQKISWVAGYDLIQRCDVMVALDLVISPAREGVCHGVETNGLASGNTYLEAIVHGLYELIERDAKSHDEFSALFAESTDTQQARVTTIDLSTLPAEPGQWVDSLLQRGLQVRVQKLESAVSVPVYGAFIVDEMFPGNEGYSMVFGGYGSDLNSTRAVLRAVTEAVQSHTAVTLAARDEFEGTRAAPDRTERLRRDLQLLHPTTFLTFESVEESSGDLLTDLDRILEKLSVAGLKKCIVIDLARNSLGIPVVRVLVPGLSPPYGYTNRRPNIRLLLNLV